MTKGIKNMLSQMNNKFKLLFIGILFISVLAIQCSEKFNKNERITGLDNIAIKKTIEALKSKHDEEAYERIENGVTQVAERWQKEDGNELEFHTFCLNNFMVEKDQLKIIFTRFQNNLESLYGNLHRISRDLTWVLDVEAGPLYPIDYLFANYAPFAHVSDDLFKTKSAFIVLLNFPVHTLQDKNETGLKWSREKWAEVRLVEEFISRVPANISQKRSETYTLADDYINNYNIFMNNLLDSAGNRLFPEGLKLISHWGLRDELKAQYAYPDGFSRQKMIQKVMQRIIQQQIPQSVINNEQIDWNPYANMIFKAGTSEEISLKKEPNTRYQHILKIFQAERSLDFYYPHAPSKIERRFNINREISEQKVEELLISILDAPVLKDIAMLIKKRLNRNLEPFDIWYNGYQSNSQLTEKELDEKVGSIYKNVQDFQEDLPFILRKLGFSPQKAAFLASHVQVDPSRGAGHATGAMMREDKAHLRTRIPPSGMKYKGYNIAIHELGHNVEQIFSLNGIDYYTMNGVPNTAFTEAFAFVFQSRDLDILGLTKSSGEAEHLRALNNMWATCEISGVALTDMRIWRWMYENPNSTPEMLKEAVINISQQIWNSHFEPIIGIKDQVLLAIYSHIVDGGMYTPDYPLGQIISFQIEEYLKNHNMATEMERMCKLGRLSPQVWMIQAIGNEISAEPLINASVQAVKYFKAK